MLRKLRSFGRKIQLYRLPKTLLLNNISLGKGELKRVLKENAIERDWYKGEPSYHSLAQILAAVATGRLVAVTPTRTYRPIVRLRNPKVAGMYPGYLAPEAKALLDEIGERWRRAMNASGLDPQITLAVTSLVRTQTYQNTIVRAGKLADPKSVHTRGQAIDIDGSGYYLGGVPINARQNRQAEFTEAFTEMGASLLGPQYGDYQLYDGRAHELLHQVLAEMQTAGKLHFVIEYGGTTNQCFHICRNPSYNGSKD